MTGAPSPANGDNPTNPSNSTKRSRVSLCNAAWRVGSFRVGLWARTWLAWALFFAFPLLTGWILKRIFDALESGETVTALLVGLGLSETGRMVVFGLAIWFVIRWWVSALTMMRTNIVRAQTVSGGPHRADLPVGPSESISRLHDDARDAVVWADTWVDVSGIGLYAVSAVAVMATIDLGAALVVLVPAGLVTLVLLRVRPLLYRADEADREATGTVNAFLGESFAGVMAFRLAGRESAAITRLEQHTAVRRDTAVRKVVLEQALDGFTSTTADVTIGLILLVLVPDVRSGDISIGDLALFVSYVTVLGDVPRFFSRLVTAGEQGRVSIGRMQEMVAPKRPEDLLAHPKISIDRGDPDVRRDPDPARVPLDRLEVSGLTVVYESTGGGVSGVDLSVERGQFVVVTGPVGAGKSTLLRALAGLATSRGSVRWNGLEIDDLGAWMVPPQAAYLPQVPRLFSESLVDNIALGRSTDHVDRAIAAAALEPDLDTMPEGLTTIIGARGQRLSGGQAQRVAAARSLLTTPELLLVDDLSSAVDVETERALWHHVRATGSTVIAVSHREFVIKMADQVIAL